jgi:hypothetical protein
MSVKFRDAQLIAVGLPLQWIGGELPRAGTCFEGALWIPVTHVYAQPDVYDSLQLNFLVGDFHGCQPGA